MSRSQRRPTQTPTYGAQALTPTQIYYLRQLRRAASHYETSPSAREYNQLDLRPTARTLAREFGSWNDAKQAAGLHTTPSGSPSRKGKHQYTIDASYFGRIDTPDRAYWLGALFNIGSLTESEYSETYTLAKARSNKWVLDGFKTATHATYPLNKTATTNSGDPIYSLTISNSEFIDSLKSHGVFDDTADYPELTGSHRHAFLRGMLESHGYFSNGWGIYTNNSAQATTIEDWLGDIGLPRATATNPDENGKCVIYITSPYDVRTLYETLWPNHDATTPTNESYPQMIRAFLSENHPFADNIDYLNN